MTLPVAKACPGHGEAVKLCLECDTGVWAVGTLSGTVYVLDLDRMTQSRWPDMRSVEKWALASAGPLLRRDRDVEETMARSRLRRDHEAVRLIGLRPVTLRESMVMVIDVVGDGVTYTTRRTNLIVEVRKLDVAGTPILVVED
jgi:hypothetical protein